jgi:hypothetical protein
MVLLSSSAATSIIHNELNGSLLPMGPGDSNDPSFDGEAAAEFLQGDNSCPRALPRRCPFTGHPSSSRRQNRSTLFLSRSGGIFAPATCRCGASDQGRMEHSTPLFQSSFPQAPAHKPAKQGSRKVTTAKSRQRRSWTLCSTRTT